jgi:hypothetical protein
VEFRSAADRFASLTRGGCVVVISVFGVVTAPARSRATAVSLFLLVLVLVLVAVRLRGLVAVRLRGPMPGAPGHTQLALAVAPVIAISGTQSWTATAGDGPNAWAFNMLTVTAITLQWQWRPAVTVPMVSGLLALHLAGDGLVLSDPGVDRLLSVIRVPVECAVAYACYRHLMRTSRDIDGLHREQRLLRQRSELARVVRHQEREYLSLLHDTAAATLMMAARKDSSIDPEELVRCAHRDLDALAGLPPGRGRSGAWIDIPVVLSAAVEQSALSVLVRSTAVPPVPAPVAVALLRATNEALANVDRHAGVRTATLTVTRHGSGLAVVVTDAGHGFDPASVSPYRRGISCSIVERMTLVGGRAELASTPGAGTSVRMVWPDG